MYGLVNLALLDFVEHRFGPDMARDVARSGGAPPGGFLRMSPYPPGTTARLVRAASESSGVAIDTLLREFGMHWSAYAMRTGYGDLIRLFGADLPTFLTNLDSMHTCLAASYPGMSAPSFRVSDVTADSLILSYESQREGFTSFVEGLVLGLGPLFDLDVRVRLVEHTTGAGTRAVFLVEFAPVTVSVPTTG